MNSRKRKTEERYFRLFVERCKKLNFQYFVKTKNVQYPMVYFWYNGLTEQQVYEQGCLYSVSEISNLWRFGYDLLKTHRQKSPAQGQA